jgi:C-terminal processing protease CtpA/Prc
VFHAYIFRSKGKEIGYIRIPDFDGDGSKVEEFRSVIAIMERRTGSLIVDVTNNPGGYSFYALALASMLANKPLVNLKENCSITQEDVYFALNDVERLSGITSDAEAINIMGEDVCGFPVDKRTAISILEHARFIKDQYKKGHYLTEASPIEGLQHIYPHATHYTKPLYILVNSLSISCADLLPALLQDNKRAKIVGCRTAGAGGYVMRRSYSNRFGVQSLFLTGSLIRRLDGTPLENRGVQPDFVYDFTVEDYTNDYAEFIRYMNTLL